jgi:GT2 family glycosyltransferase
MAKSRSLKNAYRRGARRGYEIAYPSGYARGREAGTLGFGERFEGTSIIIPTYNKVQYLVECIESLREHTEVPHEIIVIDNASRDGTAEYLKKQRHSRLRYRINRVNTGFAPAVNQGMMMARGTTIALLNNDTVVTPRWLSNMLACLRSSPRIGLVGPVSNFVSGDQLLEVRYRSLEDMQRFAAGHNLSDPRKWERTERLIGFCLLMRREVFEAVGYFDEGYEIGNYEDDDYAFRVLLSGMELVIARDTFIHHYGNLTMKELGSAAVSEVLTQNSTFYSRKWPDKQRLLALAGQAGAGKRPIPAVDLYPTCTAVQGPDGRRYWIEDGSLCPVAPEYVPFPVRLSRNDLRLYLPGEPLQPEDLQRKRALFAIAKDAGGYLISGNLYRSPDGFVYQCKGRRLHQLAGEWAMQMWQLADRPVHEIGDDEFSGYPQGPPLIAPPVLRSTVL